ncbi:hypothetical protein FRC14_001221, partial [Serendipita sp. 396]
MTHIPPSPVGVTPASTKAEGFLLLTILNTTITSTSPTYPIPQPLTGLLSIECVTLAVVDPLERDVWLVLRVEPPPSVQQPAFEFPIPATQKLILTRHLRQYTLPGIAGGELVITLPLATTPAQFEDAETLEVLLSQYAVLEIRSDPPSATGLISTSTPAAGYDADGDLKGRLVLVDEDNGQVVGTLDDQFQIQEDSALRTEGREKDPVIVDIPDPAEPDPSLGQQSWGRNEDGSPRVRRTIFVHPIVVDDSDWMSKTAGLLGRGIVGATNLVSTGVTTAANYYISHSKPAAEPITFSENTRRNVKRVHNISGQAVKVTAKTTGLIHQTVERLADRVAGVKSPPQQHSPHSGTPYGQGTPYVQGTPLASPGSGTSNRGWSSPYPGTPSGSSIPSTTNLSAPPPVPRKRRFLNRLLTSTDLLLTTVESSAHHLIGHTSTSASAVAHHKYGNDMGSAVGMVGDSMRNVGVVYIDARGVGRRALLRVAGKRILKAKMGGRDVVFQEQGLGKGQVLL